MHEVKTDTNGAANHVAMAVQVVACTSRWAHACAMRDWVVADARGSVLGAER